MTLAESTLQLPMTLEEITPQWLTAALQSYAPGIEISASKIKKIRNGFTTVLVLDVETNDIGRNAGVGPTLILKGGFEEHSRTRCRTYAMEAIAYRDLWPHLPLDVPKSYFAAVDIPRAQVVVLMEDLNARNVVWGDAEKPHSFEEASLYIKALARLHAATWDSPDIKAGGKWESKSRFGYKSKDWTGIANNGSAMLRDYLTTYDYFTPKVWNRFLEMPRNGAISVHMLDLNWAKRALEQCIKVTDALPKCIIHGDMHLGNTYWNADGTPGFFDAPPRVEPGLTELAYYIACCMDPWDRQQHEDELVQLYLDELARRGVKAHTLAEAKHFMAIFLVYGLIVFIINENAYQTEKFNTINAMRFNDMMLAYNTIDVVERSINGDPYLPGL